MRARIDKEDLPAGTYTVEVMASSPGNGGHLTLTVKDMPPKYTPPPVDRTLLSNLGQMAGSTASHDFERAQNFTTGSDANGYKLSEVQIQQVINGA